MAAGRANGAMWTRRCVASGIGALAAAGCAPARRKELVIWHAFGGRAAAALAIALDAYNGGLPPGVAAVRAVAIPQAGFAGKVTAAVPRGEGPDLFICTADHLGVWAEAGRVVEPIGFWADDGLRAGVLAPLVEALTYRGELYGLPIAFSTLAPIHNRALAPEPPATSGALVAVAKKFAAAPAGRFGLVYPYGDFFHHAALHNGFGGGVFDNQRRPMLDHPGHVAAAELLLKWKNTDQILPPDASPDQAVALFNAGRAPLAIGGPRFVAAVAPDIAIAAAPLPLLDEADGAPMRPWFVVTAAFVARGSARPEEAFRLAAYLAGPQAGRALAVEGGLLPAAAAVYADPAVLADPIAQAFAAQLDTAALMPQATDMALVWAPAERALKRVVDGAAHPVAAWADAQADVVKSIAALRRQT